MTSKYSYCRNCAANCGVAFEVEDNRIVAHKPDRNNSFSDGFMCIKGDYAVDFHMGVESRLTECLERDGNGGHRPIASAQLMDEAAVALENIIARHGPRAAAVFYGTCAYQKALTIPIAKDFMAKIGSPNLFSTMTIDQSAQWVTDGRMGNFATGRSVIDDIDVLILTGTNPLVSHGSVFTAMPNTNQAKHIKAFRARGGKLVVIDPRRTETAAQADIHLQPLPGCDTEIFACLIGIVLDHGWHDAAFCDRYVTNLAALRAAVAPFSPAAVSTRAGIDPAELLEIAACLRDGARMSAGLGTGTTMSPNPNTATHMVRALNAICGGFPRAGDPVRNPGVLLKKGTVEGVYPPNRSWESGPKLRSGHGRFYGEFPSSRLPDEILTPGEGQIRALIVVGGNPMAAFGNPALMRRALESLNLLVVIDPRMTATARLAHYVVAPPLQYEVHDFSTFADIISPVPFLQYAEPVIDPPPGTLEEWRFFNGVANRIGVELELKPFSFSTDAATMPPGLKLDRDLDWTTAGIVDWYMREAGLSREELACHPHGMAVAMPTPVIGVPDGDDGARLDVCPADVATELGEIAAAPPPPAPDYLLISRRLVDTMNSAYRQSPRVQRRHPHNPLFMHPLDMAREGVAAGDAVTLTGQHGRITGHARPDASMRRGVVSMTHCWGTVDAADNAAGRRDGNVSHLVSLAPEHVQAIDAMPQQSSIAITIARQLAPATSEEEGA